MATNERIVVTKLRVVIIMLLIFAIIVCLVDDYFEEEKGIECFFLRKENGKKLLRTINLDQREEGFWL